MSAKVDKKKPKRIRLGLMGVKYSVSVIFALLPIITMRSLSFSAAALVELAVIGALTNLIALKKPVLANIFNGVFILLFNVQMGVLFFGSSYIETIMLSNLASLQDLGGKALEYISAAAAAVVVSFLPVYPVGKDFFKKKSRKASLLIAALAAEAVLIAATGVLYSPLVNYVVLAQQEYKIYKLKKIVGNTVSSAEYFYSDEIPDYRKKDEALPENPNIILIFTEGLSQNIIDDERNIMPNVSEFQKNSLSFTNYYNHTFATYRGLIGQLYSGYQLNNFNEENNLVSLHGILESGGYQTTFINTEPLNTDFINYLQSLGFEEVMVGEPYNLEGLENSYSDRQAYEILWDKVQSQEKSGRPFFTVIYTLGTHVSFDSTDEKFGKGNNSELNKFYNADYQFGSFLEKFKKSSLAEDTIIVYTADHATYQDNDFTSAFPDYERLSTQLDTIPLCFYYEGIKAETVDASGRNTLCLAPTLLDWLDVSAPNYFLGSSLFSDISEGLSLDTIFYSENSPYSTKNGELSNLSGEDLDTFESTIQKYFAAKMSDISNDYLESIGDLSSRTEAFISEDGLELEVVYTPEEGENYTQYWFPTWSEENGQDDLVWYEGEQYKDGTWRAEIPLAKHTLNGELNIHVYGGTTGEEEKVFLDNIIRSNNLNLLN
ncbi:MAG: sulfatase-like hydrolase/transferase [Clostridiales bacterium]|nr:sulfatase-like hydrolase/transferase [Clostridiales bacterium]